MNTRTLAFLTMLLCSMLFSGCICAIGGARDQCTPVKQYATVGQELIDLKKAYDQGAITRDEYNQKKRQILSSTRK